ncbi:hypothetical protein LTR95_001740 [Oleoguttula sp. CCFEE 5521]
MAPYVCRATQTKPRWDLVRRCSTIAVDVGFQRVLYPGAAKWTQRIGRIALVDENLNTLYDVYAAYRNEAGATKATNPKRFGVIWNDLKSKNGAVPAAIVERNCRRIFEGRTVVMHAAQGDMNSFRIEEDAFVNSTIVDTQSLYHGPMGLRHPPSLADCSTDYLGQTIQMGVYSPVEDARATMQLYLLDKTGGHHAQRARLEQQRIEAYEVRLGSTLDVLEHMRPDAIALSYADVLARDMATARIVLHLQITIDEAMRRVALDATQDNDEVKSDDILSPMISTTEDHRTDDVESLEDSDDVDVDEHIFYS